MPLHRLTSAAQASEAFGFVLHDLFAHQAARAMPLHRLTSAAQADEASLSHSASPILISVPVGMLSVKHLHAHGRTCPLTTGCRNAARLIFLLLTLLLSSRADAVRALCICRASR